jgi:hypothetical protein
MISSFKINFPQFLTDQWANESNLLTWHNNILWILSEINDLSFPEFEFEEFRFVCVWFHNIHNIENCQCWWFEVRFDNQMNWKMGKPWIEHGSAEPQSTILTIIPLTLSSFDSFDHKQYHLCQWKFLLCDISKQFKSIHILRSRNEDLI